MVDDSIECDMKAKSDLVIQPSQQVKLGISSALEQLTRSETDALRQKKKRVSASYRKVIEAHVKQRLA